MKSIQYFSKRIAVLALVSFVLPMMAHAQLTKTEGIITKSTGILNTIVVIVFTLALIVFAWGIVKYLNAAGDASKMKEGKAFLFWGLLGMFVLASMWGIIRFVAGELTIDGPETQDTIKPLQIK